MSADHPLGSNFQMDGTDLETRERRGSGPSTAFTLAAKLERAADTDYENAHVWPVAVDPPRQLSGPEVALRLRAPRSKRGDGDRVVTIGDDGRGGGA